MSSGSDGERFFGKGKAIDPKENIPNYDTFGKKRGEIGYGDLFYVNETVLEKYRSMTEQELHSLIKNNISEYIEMMDNEMNFRKNEVCIALITGNGEYDRKNQDLQNVVSFFGKVLRENFKKGSIENN